jgi:hypothetical protein
MSGQPGGSSGGVRQPPERERSGVGHRAGGFHEPNTAEDSGIGQVTKHAPKQFRVHAGRDRHEGANVVSADFALFEGDAESGGGANADQIGASNPQQIQGTVAAGFTLGSAVAGRVRIT